MDVKSPPTLLESQTLSTQTKPEKKIDLAGSYVLHLTNSPLYYAASASFPSNTIHLLDKSTLTTVRALTGHDRGAAFLTISGTSLVSCGKDGTVRTWDERSGSPAVQMRTPNRNPLLSVDISPDGFTVAGGTELCGVEAYIHFWDLRNPDKPLHRPHASTHSDDITVLKFRPTGLANAGAENVLLSGSTDGLVCTSNADEDDEDEAGINVGNWTCSVSQAGWISAGPSTGPKAWAASDMETFSLWNEELDALQDFSIRKPWLSGANKWKTDYLIGAHTTSPLSTNDMGLRLFSGSNEGAIAMITPSVPGTPWTAQRIFRGAHSGIVRSVLWDEQNGILLTGGEDAAVCAWTCPPLIATDLLPVVATETGSGLGGRGVLHEDSTDADTDADTSMDADPDESAMEVDSPPNRKSKKRELDSGMNRRTMDERGGKKVKRG